MPATTGGSSSTRKAQGLMEKKNLQLLRGSFLLPSGTFCTNYHGSLALLDIALLSSSDLPTGWLGVLHHNWSTYGFSSFWVCGSNPSHLTISWWTPSKGSASCSARSLHDLTKKPGKMLVKPRKKNKPREWTKTQDSWKVWNQQTKKHWAHMAIPAPRDVYALHVPRIRPIRERPRHATAWLQRARCCNQGELYGPWEPTQTAIWWTPMALWYDSPFDGIS